MVICEICGNIYDKIFEVVMQYWIYVFDSFECVIFVLVFVCGYCGVCIVGYGLEKNGQYFCCVYCVV